MSRWMKNGLYILLGSTLISLFGIYLYLDSAWATNMPSSPQIETGRVVKRTLHHGTTVFLTDNENSCFNWIEWSMMIAFFGIATVKVIEINSRKTN